MLSSLKQRSNSKTQLPKRVECTPKSTQPFKTLSKAVLSKEMIPTNFPELPILKVQIIRLDTEAAKDVEGEVDEVVEEVGVQA